MQLHVIKSLVRKELSSYFTNPTGYAFITLFVFLSGLAAFWTPAFFERNLANLDQLNDWFGVLLILLIPAITMGAWAQERQQGTDELLLTMPATELELVLGKYFGCVSIYFICLVFAAFHVVVLSFLGRPDVGVMLSTYLTCPVGSGDRPSRSPLEGAPVESLPCRVGPGLGRVAVLLFGTFWTVHKASAHWGRGASRFVK